MKDRHGNENWYTHNRVVICAYTWPNGDRCSLPWNHADRHRDPFDPVPVSSAPSVFFYDALDVTDDAARADLSEPLGERLHDLLHAYEAVTSQPEAWEAPLLTDAIVEELRVLYAKGSDLMSDEHTSTVLVILASN